MDQTNRYQGKVCVIPPLCRNRKAGLPGPFNRLFEQRDSLSKSPSKRGFFCLVKKGKAHYPTFYFMNTESLPSIREHIPSEIINEGVVSTRQLVETVVVLDSSQDPIIPKGSILNINRFASLYRELKELYGFKRASEIAVNTYAKDLRHLAWEATKTPLPNEFFYRIIRDGDQVSLVHESDGHWNRDILEGVSSKYRDGAELEAIGNFREAIINLDLNETAILGSSKKEDEDDNCQYTDGQINYAEKLTEDLVWVRQSQSDKYGRKETSQVINETAQAPIFSPTASLREVITRVAVRKGSISTSEILQARERATGEKIENLDRFIRMEAQIKEASERNARKLLYYIQEGFMNGDLEHQFGRLLADTIGYNNFPEIEVGDYEGLLASLQTSCGEIVFGDNFRAGITPAYSFSEFSTTNYKTGECVAKGCLKPKNVLIGECKICKDCEKKSLPRSI